MFSRVRACPSARVSALGGLGKGGNSCGVSSTVTIQNLSVWRRFVFRGY